MNISKTDIDNSFRDTARRALEALETSALKFLEEHPTISTVELAKRLGQGASARGLAMLIYEEAERTGRTREIAKELLFRKVIAEFPDGWYEDKKVHPAVKLGGWKYNILEFANNSVDYAAAVLKEFAIDAEPPSGWKPHSANDERLRLVFDKCWPRGY